MSVLLIHPPAAKAGEPPLGLAVLQAHLKARGLNVCVVDANRDAYRYLLRPETLAVKAGPAPSTRLRRALRHVDSSLAFLCSPAAAVHAARYATAVRYLNDALSLYDGVSGSERLTLGDYRHGALSEYSEADMDRLAAGEEQTLFHSYFCGELLPAIKRQTPRMLALSINYRHQVLPAFELAGLLRRHFPGIPLVAGGGMITSWQSALRETGMRLPVFDHLVSGPGEQPLYDLLEAESRADYLLEDRSTLALEPDFTDLDTAGYLSPHPVLPVTASRGCYWARCLFCPEASSPTHPYKAFPGHELPQLLRSLAQRWKVRHFHLTDNAIPPSALQALAAQADRLCDLSWYGFVRFEAALLQGDLIERLARGGCRLLQLGLESGSQAVLDRLAKGTRLAIAAEVLRRLRQAGIATYVYVLLGTPGESPDEARRTKAFLEDHADCIDYLNLAIMNMPRHSALAATDAAGGASPLDLYLPVDEHATERRAARRFLQQELLATPAIKAIVNRTPPLFTSNHAFFFSPKLQVETSRKL
ncbi:radical SAM domain iron-sulfur cluster-binding oxidoreductase [Syntrophotalea carbinolica DSM 2380]|uniref:Radical SAM domain iron-sulfur cluster-binding oxidoreductase n=1 Tax=Syntrophotalea carbinolica (strain DSM 2380 / NBRC 103641 / GraBd1) TaxID=338963 RepID=Q3A1J8_SYNC1|nr:radical SAM protein [Syntrophotalea carbinolica]ABA89759.1 radical SAM domain iron-sulfur cluster-binding oxidoreductase [Syntrophotalea carbinolica DSM 2380]